MENNHESMDDELLFLDDVENTDPNSPSIEPLTWRIMIVDDDPDVHSATTFALSNLAIQGRNLSFLHAYSASEAKQMLVAEKDIPVILLDVVMEQDDAGLQLVNVIRNEIGLSEVRIILRTGQPGYAPEIDAIRDYDINDYKTKSELTRTKLFTTVTSAVRSYDQICAIKSLLHGSDMTIKSSRELILKTNLNDFSECAVQNLSHYFAQNNTDILLAKLEPANETFSLLAGHGKYTQITTEPETILNNIIESDNPILLPSIEACFNQQQHVTNPYDAALYLNNSTATRYALYIKRDKPLTPQDTRFLEVYSSNASVCLDNVLLNTRLRDQAFIDPLTLLPNRLKMLHFIDDVLSVSEHKETSLALVDIDNFAEVNNALGHQFGDALLITVAKRLSQHFDQTCKVARITSDCFAIMGNNQHVCPEVILPLFDTPFAIENQDAQISATVGLVKLGEYEGNSTDALKDTNIALKRAKKQQRGNFIYFTNNMGTEIRERVKLMRALNNALEKNQLFVVYQPQVDIGSGKVVGAEALIRWKTPEGKFIPPDQFIPIAEYSGLIIEIGEWVLRTACFQLKELIDAGYNDFKMSVNVSQTQFSHPEFLNTVKNALNDTQIPAHLLDLEITESMAMDDPHFLLETLHKLKSLGIKISIDDFGTGFSSLSFIQKLPIDQLKIDRSFVTPIEDENSIASIPKMIIQLCKSLNISVISEGIENLNQALALSSFGCPYAQGYYYSKPLEVPQLLTWLKERN